MSHLTRVLHRRSNERRLCEILDIDASSDENHIKFVRFLNWFHLRAIVFRLWLSVRDIAVSFVHGYLCEILQSLSFMVICARDIVFLTQMRSSFVMSLFGVTLLLAVCLGIVATRVVATRVVATAKPAVVVLCRSEKPIKSFFFI